MSDPTDAEREWAREQLSRSGVPRNAQSAVMQLFTQWSYSYIRNLSLSEREVALDAFYKLAKNQSLVPDDDPTVWEPARRGNIYRGDKVRVKPDAYRGDGGREHNGRLGTVVAIRHGDVLVRYTDDKQPNPDMGVRHTPETLDREVR